MTKKLTLALDCDGVLFDCNAYVRDVAQKVLRRKLPPPADHHSFDFDVALGLSYDEWTRVQSRILDGHATRDMLWLPRAQAFVQALLNGGHDVFFLTSHWRGAPHWVVDRERRLNKAFPDCDVVFAHNKTRCQFDYLVDDKVSTIEAVGPERGILFDQPWNRNYGGAYRALSYDDVLSYIRSKS